MCLTFARAPCNISLIQWAQLIKLDEEQYGISGPVLIKPLFLIEDTLKTYVFEANVQLKIFHRELDIYHIYLVRSNLFENSLITVKTTLNSTSIKIASSDAIIPTDCHTSPLEKLRICHKLPLDPSMMTSIADLATCGKALFSKVFTQNITKCHMENLTTPYIYRAGYKENEQSTVVVNLITPLTLEFTCDTTLGLTRNFTVFPSKITANCAVSTVENGVSTIVLPQLHADYLQNPLVDYISSPDLSHVPAVMTFSFEIKIVVIFSVTLSVIFLVTIILTLICYFAKRPQTEPVPA